MTSHSDTAVANDPRRSLKVAIIALRALAMLLHPPSRAARSPGEATVYAALGTESR